MSLQKKLESTILYSILYLQALRTSFQQQPDLFPESGRISDVNFISVKNLNLDNRTQIRNVSWLKHAKYLVGWQNEDLIEIVFV